MAILKLKQSTCTDIQSFIAVATRQKLNISLKNIVIINIYQNYSTKIFSSHWDNCGINVCIKPVPEYGEKTK